MKGSKSRRKGEEDLPMSIRERYRDPMPDPEKHQRPQKRPKIEHSVGEKKAIEDGEKKT